MKKTEKYNAHKEWLEHPLTRELLDIVLPREEARLRTFIGWGHAKDWEEYKAMQVQAQTYLSLVEDIKNRAWFWETEEEETET